MERRSRPAPGAPRSAEGEECGLATASRRPPFRVRPPLGRWEWRVGLRTHKPLRPRFALGLKSRVRPARVVFKEMISRVLDSLAGNPLSRAFARVRKKGNVGCRSLGTRRALALLRVPSHHLAFDHQMTPPLFAGAFRAFGPYAPLTSARLSGTASRALRPKASHRAGLRGVLSSVEKRAA